MAHVGGRLAHDWQPPSRGTTAPGSGQEALATGVRGLGVAGPDGDARAAPGIAQRIPPRTMAAAPTLKVAIARPRPQSRWFGEFSPGRRRPASGPAWRSGFC